MKDELPQRTGLSLLFGDYADEFLARHWPDDSYVFHGDLERFAHSGSVFSGKPLEEILSDIGRPVDAVGPGGFRVTCADPADAIRHYNEDQAMIYMTGLHQYSDIQNICDQVALDLGIPAQFVTCEGFAARKGSEVSLHFDHETNIMVQIRGRKTWGIKQNDLLTNPLHCYFADKPNRFYQNGVQPFSGLDMNKNLPEEILYFGVGPGTTTFLPRGFWHMTEAIDDSFSISIVIDPPTLLEVAFSYLSGRLHKDTRWRAHPLCPVGSGGPETQQFTQDLGRLLVELEQVAASADQNEIVREFFAANRQQNVREYHVGY